jgi:CRP-like cAMP-binding protein
MSEIRRYHLGDEIIREGDTGRGFFMLQSGVVEVFKGRVSIAELASPGTLFGEMSDLLDKPRTCSVVAKTMCELLHYEEGIEDVIEHEPAIAKRLIHDLAKRLDDTTARISDHDEVSLVFFEEPLR